MSQSQLDRQEFDDLFHEIGKLVARSGKGSALNGLAAVAVALAVVMDVYALPNPDNPKGMCDDPKKFRHYFAHILLGAPGPGQTKFED